MQKKFLSNLILIILLNLLVKPLWVLGIDVTVQNRLGPAEYGNYFALLNLAFLFVVALDFGLNNYTNRKISRKPESFENLFLPLSTLKLLLSIGFFGIANLAIFLLGYTAFERSIFMNISFMFIAQYFLLFLRANLSGIQKYRSDVLISVLDKSLMIVFVALLLWTEVFQTGLTVFSFIHAQTAAYLISGVVVLGLLFSARTSSFQFSFSPLKGILKQVLPYALLGFLMLFYFKLDSVMIERMLPNGDLEAGMYAQAYKLLDASVMFALLFSTLLLPMFSNLLGRDESISELVAVSSRLLFVPAVIVCVICWFYAYELLDVLFVSDVQSSAAVFPFLMTVLIPLGGSYIYGTLITAQGDLKLLNWISVGAILVNAVGNYFAIQHYGILGAAIVTLVTQSLVFLVQFVVCNLRFKLEFNSAKLFKTALIVILAISVTYASKYVELDWRVKCFSLFGGFLILSMVFGMLNLKMLNSLKKGTFRE